LSEEELKTLTAENRKDFNRAIYAIAFMDCFRLFAGANDKDGGVAKTAFVLEYAFPKLSPSMNREAIAQIMEYVMGQKNWKVIMDIMTSKMSKDLMMTTLQKDGFGLKKLLENAESRDINKELR